jgi:predicted nucleotide-binding protein (sugar kinase/HSP70/actin superfamily)
MDQREDATSATSRLPSTEELIRERLEEERTRLEQELGIESHEVQHFERPAERPFTRDQRPHTTVLFGGLTWKHERLIEGGLAGLGYQCEAMPVPDVAAFQLGKEYGNNGQCNPTYFTVGNLVKYLQGLEREGRSRQEILDRYIFVTAGACGPCRFGMYEAEYRLALRNSGFDGFRVILFQQAGGITQSGAEAGLEMDLDFFLAILNAMNMGDLLNDIGYQLRPFEVEAGAVDDALATGMELLYEVLRDKRTFSLESYVARLLADRKLGDITRKAGKFADQLVTSAYTDAFREVGDVLAGVRLDRTRVRPIVKITGEFWAQTTEGDGNYNMFAFLEREGAQVVVEPVGTWIMYIIHQAKQMILDRRHTDEDEAMPAAWRLDRRMINELRARRKNAKLTLAEAVFKREWQRLRAALNGIPHDLTDQYELQRLGHPYYNSRSGGGEGHLEVAKNIYYSNKDLCHMVLSLKPFGCMPSTQSDGVQSAVVNHYKDMIYLPIETSGEGEVNAHSRVQMALGEARLKAREEIERVEERTGMTLEQAREFAAEHSYLESAMYKVPHTQGCVGTAANFLIHVAELHAAESRGRIAVPWGIAR